ncbi:MAG: 16S rRNA (cytosine(967)-C(5))-methyltransferase RsmB [Candidatus Abyssobacteria bacterium SURF_5]|uniref:16S rRNA (cytosine(967)-C(5))-methyltransferase n=1 Tax=Abyssobacteria bacterium (strain SURF_5) TaxID=2093360 RepID=A0A3A4N3H0_ABYX5|nr:MAG: 16S rRNA (cytosine(967)-C(5))-methyltransferase RsmB [Candidatus Abyssubacteria bacterium SURF_5]
MPKQLVDPAREQALKILRKTEAALSFTKLLLASQEEAAASDLARAFIHQLVMGALRTRGTLDWALSRQSTTPLEELSSWIRNILRLGLYQILYLDRVPKSAAVDESVKLAKKYGHAGTAGLVNAVLRNSHREELLRAVDALPEDNAADLSVKYSHPQWMVEQFIQDWGSERTITILKNNNKMPPLSARVNALRTDRRKLLEQLEREGVQASPVPLLEEAVEFAAGATPWKLPAHEKGLFYLQDVSSMFASYCLDVRPGHTVLDACAGPGGKATHLAALMRNQGKINALDVHEHRLGLIRENAARLGAAIVETKEQDATEDLTPLFSGADRVLADVPCSGLGVIRRRVDLKWRLRPEQIPALVELQAKILERASECLKPGGLLVYSTCTIAKRENERLVEGFLSRHSRFEVDPHVPKPLEKYLTSKGFVQILPGDENMDGFFIARLRRL